MRKRFQSGQSLMEILVGLGIISIMVGASTYALVSVMRSSSMTEQNQSAGLIANSLLESVSTLAEANWNSIYNIQKTLSNHYYLVRSSTTTPTPVYGDEGVLEQDVINGLVGHWKMDEHSGTTAYDSSGNGNSGTLTNIPDINSGLVGYWKFDEESGTTATDFSGYNNTGTLINSPTRNDSENCKFGGCLSFNGTNTYVNAGTGITDSLETAGSIGMWIYPNALGGIFSRSVNTSWAGERIALNFYSTGGKLDLTFSNGTSYWRHYSNSVVPLGRWTHILVNWNGTTVNFYFNGVLDRSLSQGGIPEITGVKTWIGRTEGLTPDFFNGKMDDVRIYNRVLTASEVSRLYNMNACKVGSCLAFNGTNQYLNLGNISVFDFQDVFSVTGWFYVNDFPTGSDACGRRYPLVTNRDYGWRSNITNTNKINIGRYYTSSGNYSYTSNTTLTTGRWYHYAMVQDSNTLRLYIDGVLDGYVSAPIITNYYTAGDMPEIARTYCGGVYYYFKGLLDDVRIYNRALSASEISQLYNSPVYSRYFYVDNVKRTVCGTGDITTDAESTCIGTSGVAEDPATQKITVGTSWNFRGIKDTLENYIYVTRWVNSAGYQSDWSGNAGIASAVTEFAANYFSADGIEVTASGTIKVIGTVADNPAPTTTSISPSIKTIGSAEFTLTVNGTNFITGSVVKFNGVNRTTTYVSAVQLTAIIPASDLTTSGNFNITVYNPSPGGGTSNAQVFSVSGLAGFDYLVPINITENSGSNLTDFPVLLTLNTASLISSNKMNPDCSDMRFTDSDGETLLNYYLESGCNTTTTKVWVKIPSLLALIKNNNFGWFNIPIALASTPKTIYLYYGKYSATSLSSITNVFDIVNYGSLSSYMNGYNEFWFYLEGSSVFFLKVKENGTQFVPGQDAKYTWTKISATAHWDNPAGPGWYNGESGWEDYGTGVWNYWAAGDCNGCSAHILKFVGNGRSGYYSYGSTYHADFVGTDGTYSFYGNEGGSSSLTGPLVTYRIKHVNPDPTYVLGTEQLIGEIEDNPVPTTTSISPTSKYAGEAQFTLTVNGTNFMYSSVVNFNGSARSTTYVSPTQLSATILAADIANTGSYSITVTNPTPGGGNSNAQTLTVNEAPSNPICGLGAMAGMQGYWKLNGNANDYLGTYNGSLNGGTFTTGKIGNGLNGAQECSAAGDVLISSFPNFTGDMTVGAWINPSCSSWQGAFSVAKNADSGYNGPGYYIMSQPSPYGSSNYIFHFRIGSSSASVTTSSTLYACGWHFVVATRTAGEFVRIYVDGVLSGTPTADTAGDPSHSGALAFHGFSSGGCGWGMSAEVVDEVFVFNRALSASEIANMYTRSNGGDTYCE